MDIGINVLQQGKERLLDILLKICMTAAVITIFYGIYFQLQDLVTFNICFVAITLIAFIFRLRNNLTVSYQVILLGYLSIVTYSVNSDATYHASILFYVVIALLPTFFSENRRTHIFYLLISVACGMIYYYFFPPIITRHEPYRVLVELITTGGLILLLYNMSNMSRKLIIDKSFQLEASEKNSSNRIKLLAIEMKLYVRPTLTSISTLTQTYN